MILVSCLVLLACGGSSSDSDNDPVSGDLCNIVGANPKVINGVPCDGLNQASVVRVALLARKGDEQLAFAVCSGTMITPRNVLTAAHCFPATVGGLPVIGYGVIVGPADDLRYVDGVSRSIAPGYTSTPGLDRQDAAVITLAESPGVGTMPVSVGVEPDIGDEVFVYGYGQTEIGDPDSATFDDLVAGKMEVQDIDRFFIYSEFTSSSSNVCNGDSGGPMVWRGPNGYAIVGVVSSGTSEDCDKGDLTAFTNLASNALNSWLAPFLN
jgi:secreted trypsin-like serine protease